MNKKRSILSFLCILFLFTVFKQGYKVDITAFAATANNTATLVSSTFIDTLKDGMVINNEDINLEGWSLNATGVKEIKVYLDNKYLGSATIGISRPDVDKVFPGYINGENSGFKYTISKNLVSLGSHQVKLVSVGNDNKEYTLITKFTLTKPQPYTHIDTLKSGVVINDEDVLLKGWALNPSGVKQIKVYLDNVYVKDATIGISRPDVGVAYPEFLNSENSGFTYTINKGLLSSGNHEVKLISVGNDGSEYVSIIKFTFKKLEPYTHIDTLKDGMTINNKDVTVEGWSLSSSGIKEMKVYIDNKFIDNATVGISRADVGKVFPAYTHGSNSGYKLVLDKNLISAGTHVMKLTAISNDGSIHNTTVKFYLSKPAPYTHIDTIKDGQTINNKDLNLNGWSLNASGIKEIKVFINGINKGSATIGNSRPDVGAAFPMYTNASNSGFNMVIDKDTIKPGSYTLVTEAYGIDGSVNKTITRFTMVKPSPYTFVDSVKDNQTINSAVLDIAGWSINAAPITTLQVYVDGSYKGDAALGLNRSDVGTAYPQYANSANSGFSYKLDTMKLTVGKHVIKLIAYAKDGTAYVNEFNIINNGIVVNYNYTNSSLDYWVLKEVAKQSNVVWNRGPATFDEIKYYMNPKNFVNDANGKYMFMRLTYVDGITVDDLNKLLVGKGVLQGKGEIFLRAAKEANINPIYLISHALLETGNGSSALSNGISVSALHKNAPKLDANGQVVKDANGNVIYEIVVEKQVEPKVTYNMFGIGAYDSNANMWGSETAYKEGWFSVDSAIMGGAKWIASGYITNTTYKQNTLYKMRWNLNENYMWHQYATDIAWAYKQTLNIRKLVDQMDKPVLIFDIPVLN